MTIDRDPQKNDSIALAPFLWLNIPVEIIPAILFLNLHGPREYLRDGPWLNQLWSIMSPTSALNTGKAKKAQAGTSQLCHRPKRKGGILAIERC